MNDLVEAGKKDKLNYYVCESRESMGKIAAQLGGERITELLKTKQEVRIVFAAAPSQDEVLKHLTANKEVDWSRITCFHMDEYLGLPSDSDQLFKRYLQKNITDRVGVKDFHFINGSENPQKEIQRYTKLLNEDVVDIVFLGIGENGHIAFNDPPVADFADPYTIKMVELDQYSRQQQVNDGCFPSLQEVPTHALTLTIPALTSASSMICTVPGKLKKNAVQNTLSAEINTSCPATILRNHSDAHLILDSEAFGRD